MVPRRTFDSTEAYAYSVMQQAVAEMMNNLGFSASTQGVLNLLTDITQRYLQQIAAKVVPYTELGGRTEPTLGDLEMAFRDMQFSVVELHNFMRQVDSHPLPKQIPLFPVRKSPQQRVICSKLSERELKERPFFIPAHLPPLHPEWCRGNEEHAVETVAPVEKAVRAEETEAPRSRPTQSKLLAPEFLGMTAKELGFTRPQKMATLLCPGLSTETSASPSLQKLPSVDAQSSSKTKGNAMRQVVKAEKGAESASNVARPVNVVKAVGLHCNKSVIEQRKNENYASSERRSGMFGMPPLAAVHSENEEKVKKKKKDKDKEKERNKFEKDKHKEKHEDRKKPATSGTAEDTLVVPVSSPIGLTLHEEPSKNNVEKKVVETCKMDTEGDVTEAATNARTLEKIKVDVFKSTMKTHLQKEAVEHVGFMKNLSISKQDLGRSVPHDENLCEPLVVKNRTADTVSKLEVMSEENTGSNKLPEIPENLLPEITDGTFSTSGIVSPSLLPSDVDTVHKAAVSWQINESSKAIKVVLSRPIGQKEFKAYSPAGPPESLLTAPSQVHLSPTLQDLEKSSEKKKKHKKDKGKHRNKEHKRKEKRKEKRHNKDEGRMDENECLQRVVEKLPTGEPLNEEMPLKIPKLKIRLGGSAANSIDTSSSEMVTCASLESCLYDQETSSQNKPLQLLSTSELPAVAPTQNACKSKKARKRMLSVSKTEEKAHSKKSRTLEQKKPADVDVGELNVNEISLSKAEHVRSAKSKTSEVFIMASSSNKTKRINKKKSSLSGVTNSVLEPSVKQSRNISSSSHKKLKHDIKREIHAVVMDKPGLERDIVAEKMEKFSDSIEQVIEAKPTSEVELEGGGLNKEDLTLTLKSGDQMYEVGVDKSASGNFQLVRGFKEMQQRQESFLCEKKLKDDEKGKKERDCVGKRSGENMSVSGPSNLSIQKSVEENVIEISRTKHPGEHGSSESTEKREAGEQERQKVLAATPTSGEKLSKENMQLHKEYETHTRKYGGHLAKKKWDKSLSALEKSHLIKNDGRKQNVEGLPVRNNFRSDCKTSVTKEKEKMKHFVGDNKERAEKDKQKGSTDLAVDEKKRGLFVREEDVGKLNRMEKERPSAQLEENGKEVHVRKIHSTKAEKECDKELVDKASTKGKQPVNGLQLKSDELKIRQDGNKIEITVNQSDKTKRNGSSLLGVPEKKRKKSDASSNKHGLSKHFSAVKRSKVNENPAFPKKMGSKIEKRSDTAAEKSKSSASEVSKSKEKIREKNGTAVDVKQLRGKVEDFNKRKTSSGDKYKLRKEKTMRNVQVSSSLNLSKKYSTTIEYSCKEICGPETGNNESKAKKTEGISKTCKEFNAQSLPCSNIKEKITSSFHEDEASQPGPSGIHSVIPNTRVDSDIFVAASSSSSESKVCSDRKSSSADDSEDSLDNMWICPECSVAYVEGATDMVGCDACDNWFHWSCVGLVVAPPVDVPWFCQSCAKKKVVKKGNRTKGPLSTRKARK